MAHTKINDAALETLRDISADVTESDFVPYAIHYDPDTILTKNGELLQIIKITGFAHEDITAGETDLRETIRTAIRDCITSTDYALWIHTIRRQKNLSPKGEYGKDFSGYLHQCWREKNHFDHAFTNEVYITVIKEGQAARLVDPAALMRGFKPSVNHAHRLKHLEKMHEDLENTANRMLEVLSSYGAKRLGVIEKDGTFYSQPCSFLGKLTTLIDQPWPLPEADLSRYITDYDVTFGTTAMAVHEPDGRQRFGAILTLKEYKELPLAVMDRFLQLPIEFIVTQCFDFINPKKAKKEYTSHQEVFEISRKSELAEKIGLTLVLASDRGQPTDYGEQQMTVFLLANSLKELNQTVQTAVDGLTELGVLAMREDIKLEDCYWAQLPANFEFLRRMKPINTSRIAGFASLSNLPAGLVEGNLWGPAVTVFRTMATTPYCFNFHIGDNGHTMLVGSFGAGKTVLMNFLISEARKFNPRLFYFDEQRASEIFIRSLGGTYVRFEKALPERPIFNPFTLPLDEQNRSFLRVWLDALIGIDDSPHADLFNRALNALYKKPTDERHLPAFVAELQTESPEVAAKYALWLEGGTHAHLFGKTETLDFTTHILGFDMTPLVADKVALVPVLSYLLHRFARLLDGTPAMLVLDEAWKLLDNAWIGPRLGEWLAMLRENNALALLATEHVEEALKSSLSPALMQHIATQIYLPDAKVTPGYHQVFGLEEYEVECVRTMNTDERQFMLKRGQETIVCELDLAGLNDCLSMLSARPETLQLMEKAMASRGSAPSKWIPEFIKKL